MGNIRSFFGEIVLDFILVLIFLLRYLPIGYTKTLKNKVHSSANVVHNLKYLTLTELTEYNIEDLNIFISDKSLLPSVQTHISSHLFPIFLSYILTGSSFTSLAHYRFQRTLRLMKACVYHDRLAAVLFPDLYGSRSRPVPK